MMRINWYKKVYHILLIAIAILLTILLYNIYPFVKSYVDACAVQNTYIIEEVKTGELNDETDETANEKIFDTVKYPFLIDFKPLTIEHESLKKINSDYIGWIDIPETEISYPVFYSKDNENYMHTDALTGKYKYAGSIFADQSYDDTARNITLYGHNMKIGTMFSELNKYGNKSFYAEHPYFVFYPYGGGNYEVYQIFSCFVLPGNDPDGVIQKYHFEGDEEFPSFLKDIKMRSIYDTGVEPGIPEKAMTLCTCHGKHANDQRFVVIGKHIEDLLYSENAE